MTIYSYYSPMAPSEIISNIENLDCGHNEGYIGQVSSSEFTIIYYPGYRLNRGSKTAYLVSFNATVSEKDGGSLIRGSYQRTHNDRIVIWFFRVAVVVMFMILMVLLFATRSVHLLIPLALVFASPFIVEPTLKSSAKKGARQIAFFLKNELSARPHLNTLQ